MLRRWHVLLLILVTLAAFCGLAAAKLRATPKYDRIQVGMTEADVAGIFGSPFAYVPRAPPIDPKKYVAWKLDEGDVVLGFDDDGTGYKVRYMRIDHRGPLERLAWLIGWR